MGIEPFGFIRTGMKPWVGRFDVPPESNPRSGWYEGLRYEATTPSQLSEEM